MRIGTIRMGEKSKGREEEGSREGKGKEREGGRGGRIGTVSDKCEYPVSIR